MLFDGRRQWDYGPRELGSARENGPDPQGGILGKAPDSSQQDFLAFRVAAGKLAGRDIKTPLL